jgi:hypothetical protein
MKRFFILISFLACFILNFSFTSKAYNYNIRFTVNEDGKISGYSLSDPGGVNEVKTKITGTFDSTKKILSFTETTVLRSKVDLKKNELCFVKADLKMKKSAAFETLSGDFVGIEPGKTEPCATGVIEIQNTKRIKAALKMVEERDSIKTLVKDYKQDRKEFKKDNSTKITDTKGKEFLVSSNKVKLTIWDKGKVDGDMITISLNGKIILEKYVLTAQTKIIELTLDNIDINTIKIIALNEGTLPPNTAAIKIETTLEQYPILTEAKVNEERIIYLKKK